MTPYDLFISTAEVPFDWGDARPAANLGGDAAFPGAPVHDGSPGPSKGANPGTGEPPTYLSTCHRNILFWLTFQSLCSCLISDFCLSNHA